MLILKLDFYEVKEINDKLSIEDKKRMAALLVKPLDCEDIKEVFVSVLENLPTDTAKELIKELGERSMKC